MTENAGEQATRERLLEAAGRLFADKGFDATSIRDICEAAGANVASVNYYFGDKEKLYRELVTGSISRTMAKYPIEPAEDLSRLPEERLYELIRAAMFRRLDPERPPWHERVMWREFSNPRLELREIINGKFAGILDVLAEIIKSIVGEAMPDEDYLPRLMGSIAGQFLFFGHKKGPFKMLFENLDVSTAKGIEEIARHITDFSIAAIRNMKGLRSVSKEQAKREGEIRE